MGDPELRARSLHHMASSRLDGLISWHLIDQIGRNHVKMNHENHMRNIENEPRKSHENVERNFVSDFA